jgi:hypothetical protein
MLTRAVVSRFSRPRRPYQAGLALGSAILVLSGNALAQSTIRQPGERVQYSFEAEPHLLVGPFAPPGFEGGTGFGAGFRGTIEIVPRGFIGPLNDSIGIGFGADWLHYPWAGDPRGQCLAFTTGQAGVPVCVEVEGAGSRANYIFLPVVMQWNFWLTRQWSVFGEPGIALHLREFDDIGFQPFVFYAGGRFHFSERATLTIRLGYPSFSLGVSFLL